MNDIFETNSVTLILLKIFDIYLCHYFATNMKIAITHLWHAIEPQTTSQLIAKDKVGEQHILRKYCNCNRKSSYYLAMQCAIGLKLYHVTAYKKVDE